MSTKRTPILCVICNKPAHREDRVRTRKGGHTHRSCLERATRAGRAGAGLAPPVPPKRTPRPRSEQPAVPSPAAAPAQRRGPGSPSRYAGQCPMCQKPYPAQTLVSKIFAGWAHTSCVFPDSTRQLSPGAQSFLDNKNAVLSGETFRGQKPSAWRRK